MKNNSVLQRRMLFAAALACFFSGTPVIGQVWNLPGSGTWADSDTDFTPTYNNGGPATFSNAAGGTITLTNPLTPTLTTVDATSGTYIFQTGIISGTGSLVKSNGGTLDLRSANTFTGGVTVNGGLLIFAGTGSVANNAANTLTINNGGTVRISRNDTWGNHNATVVIPIVVNAGGLLTNSTTASYTTLGPVTLNGGSITSTGGANGSFQAFSFKSTVTVNGATTSTISGSGTNSNFQLGAAAVTGTTFNVADGAALNDLLVSGILMNGRNAGFGDQVSSLTKSGTGLMSLTGVNTYTGTTNISAGTLALTGAGTLGTGNVIVNGTLDIAGITAANYTLGTAQVLSGDGTITATSKTLNVNGTLAPGNSAGSLDVTGNVVLAGTTTANFEIDGPSSNDLLNVTGSLTYDGALNINTTETTGSFDLFNFGSLTGDFDSITLSNAFTGSLTTGGGGIWTGTDGMVMATFTGSTGVLNFAVIPEPSTLVLGGMALLGFAGVGLRRRRLTQSK